MIVDSSVWIEILSSGPLRARCENLIAKAQIRVPTVVLFEVYRKVKAKLADEEALQVVAGLSRFEVLDLTREIALLAAELAIEHRLAMADSLVLAHARQLETELLTLDNDFAGLPGARVIRK